MIVTDKGTGIRKEKNPAVFSLFTENNGKMPPKIRRKSYFQPRILHIAKLSIKCENRVNMFSEIQGIKICNSNS